MNEQETLTALAAGGSQALAGLKKRADVQHGATWYHGNVAADGSTAYLYLGKLGEGAATLLLVMRYEGARAADFSRCTIWVDGVEVGSLTPGLNRVEQPSDGSVRQLADVHFDYVRPAVLTMIGGQSAVIRTADGKDIRLNRAELEEMRRVLSAYLHLQGGAP